KDAFAPAQEDRGSKKPARVEGCFVYVPSRTLRKRGYWSWPGSSFDPEGQQKRYEKKIDGMAERLDMQVRMQQDPIHSDEAVARFLRRVKKADPDSVLVVCFKKRQWGRVRRIVDEVEVPTIVVAPTGVLLAPHINQLRGRTGTYLISTSNEKAFGPLEDGLGMVAADRWMQQACIVDLRGDTRQESEVANLGTRVRTVPLQRFVQSMQQQEATDEVKRLARRYLEESREMVECSRSDVVDGAKSYYNLKRITADEGGDAVMMHCLPGLTKPHEHPPPCMGFMSLRDEGIPAGCQSDLDATLTMMLVQKLFGKPGFQQNAAMDTERNEYYGAHCTCASKMGGLEADSEPYLLRTHSEAGWGCVPQVLFPQGQEVTMAKYRSGDEPQMVIYSGEVTRCFPGSTAGCRTNVQMTINEVDDVCETKGMHQVIFYGDHADQLRTFCQLHGIEVVS
ncbi:MAG: hypothetical protein V5A84_01225, partial [Planctomycetota bacterium]